MQLRPTSWLGAILVLMLFTSPLLARQVNIHLRDGRVISGTFVSEDENSVTVRISQIDTTFDRENIRRLETLPGIEEQYAQRRAEVRDSDVAGRLSLIHWLVNQQAFELAQREAEALRRDAPDDERPAALARTIERQRQAIAERQARQATGEDIPTAPTVRDGQMLNEEQINLIKVYEIDLEQRPPVVIPRETLDAFLQAYSDREGMPRGQAQQAAFRGLPGWQQLELMFQHRARQFYPAVRVRTDPPALAAFRREIHTHYVVNYCATSGCHGGPDAGSFVLLREGRRGDEQIYTNFFILSQYESPAGLMINRQDPARSLLLQYGLEPRSARSPHPKAANWRPQFPNEEAARFQAMVVWINTLYPNPPSNYDINYTPPGAGRAAAPAADEAPAAGEAEPK